MSNPVKQVVAQVVHDLRTRPMDFVCGSCTLHDKVTRIQYWIGNGSISSGVYQPHELNFGFFQGRKFWKAFKQWQAFILIHRCEAVDSSPECRNITPKPKQLTSNSSTQKN